MKLSRPEHVPIPSPAEIFEHLSRHVVGQDRAKRAIALAAYSHLRRAEARRRGYAGTLRKANVLLIGPTGSGKTLLARHLADIIRAPFTSSDATEYTEAGYYGRDVELMITDLYERANRSIEETEHGVVFIDEVDKIARRTQGAQNGAGARDIGGEGVQQALLKVMEGRAIAVPTGSAQWGRHDSVQIDTTDILFLCAGTFSDIHAGRASQKPIGFGAVSSARRVSRRRSQQEELLAFGMLAEFLGRMPVVVELEALSVEQLVRVLTEPQESIVREYTERLALDGVELLIRPAALKVVAGEARECGVGARGLRSIMEDVCSEILFEAPTNPRRRFVIDAAYVRRRLREHVHYSGVTRTERLRDTVSR